MDHDFFKYLIKKLDLFRRIVGWILLLQDFNYEVVVKSKKFTLYVDFSFKASRSEGCERYFCKVFG